MIIRPALNLYDIMYIPWREYLFDRNSTDNKKSCNRDREIYCFMVMSGNNYLYYYLYYYL